MAVSHSPWLEVRQTSWASEASVHVQRGFPEKQETSLPSATQSPVTTHHGAVSRAVPTPGVVLQQVWHSCSLSAVFYFAEPVAAGTTQGWPQSEDYSSSSSLEKARQPKNKEQLEEGEAHITAREILTGLWILFTQAAPHLPLQAPKIQTFCLTRSTDKIKERRQMFQQLEWLSTETWACILAL